MKPVLAILAITLIVYILIYLFRYRYKSPDITVESKKIIRYLLKISVPKGLRVVKVDRLEIYKKADLRNKNLMYIALTYCYEQGLLRAVKTEEQADYAMITAKGIDFAEKE